MITTRNARVAEILKLGRAQKDADERVRYQRNWAKLRKKDKNRRPPRLVPGIMPDSQNLEFVLKDGDWTGQRCFIIGGGPSLKGFDFSVLKGERVIGVNRAFEFCDCDILLAMDGEGQTFYGWLTSGKLGEEAKRKFNDFNGIKIWCGEPVEGVYHIQNNGQDGLSSSIKDGLSTGGNSGYAALNLAVCLGANPIYLLGFDMQGDGEGKQTWFHDGYPDNQGESVYRDFIKSFNQISDEIKRRGFDVVNLNPQSKLECFRFGMFDEIKNLGKKTIFFDGCLGFGDNFQQRPLIKKLASQYQTVYVRTALPEAYWDIPNVKFVHPGPINLRTQRQHMARVTPELWAEAPRDIETIGWRQAFPKQTSGGPAINIAQHIKQTNQIQDYDFLFPVKNAWVEDAKKVIANLNLARKKLCIIKQPTQRREWNCPARNPKTEYFQLLVDRYKSEYFFLNIADVKEGEEWFDAPLCGIDAEFIRGELPLTTIFGLMKLADMVLTYPGFFMPAAIAIRAKCLVIFGGHAAPTMHIDEIMALENFAYIAPEPFCHCFDANHGCNKDIAVERLLDVFEALRMRPRKEKAVTVGCAPGLGDVHWVMTKMESFKEKNGIDKLTVAVCDNGYHKYTTQYLKLIPFVDEVETRTEHFRIGVFCGQKSFSLIKNFQGTDYLIDVGANMFFKGKTINEILPEYDAHYDFEIKNPPEAKRFALELKEKNQGKLVLFYTSAIGNNDNWNRDSWAFANWITLAEKMNEECGARPILMGAKWDKDYALELKRLDKGNVLQDLVGDTDIPQALALIREARLLVGFPCGLPILSVYLGRPTVMFWPINEVSTNGRFHKDFMYAWVPPSINGSGRYIPLPYGGPNTNPEWVFDHVKEFL